MTDTDEISLDHAVQSWVKRLECEGKAQATLHAYLCDVSRALAFLSQHRGNLLTITDLSSLEMADMRAWLAWEQKQGKSAASRARALAALRAFARYLECAYSITVSALMRLRSPRLRRSIPRALSEEQVMTLLDAVVATSSHWIDLRDHALLILLYGCGLRISEALSLRASQTPLHEEIMITGKRNKQRLLPVLPEVKAAIEAYHGACPYPLIGSGPLFLGARGGPLRARLAQLRIAQLRTKLGLGETSNTPRLAP